MLLSVDVGALLTYSRSGALTKEVRDALAKAAQLRQSVMDSERQMADRAQRLTQIAQEQGRIREDMKTVASTTAYYARLLAKLNEQESTIERLQREREELAARRDGQRRELEEYLSNLVVG